MSKAINSPTGRLLRNSRVFSLPRPLPQPQLDSASGSGSVFVSDTATHPYPTRQAIATPSSSRHRGDWGLKRPLPQRTNNSSTPHLRIIAIDNDAHVTDFQSAADHTQNLAKFQQMNIAMNASFRRKEYFPDTKSLPVSAFDESVDNISYVRRDKDSGNINQGASQAMNRMIGSKLAMERYNSTDVQERWKVDGPWLAGLTGDEFEGYLKIMKNAEFRRSFRRFLERVKVQDKRRKEEARLRQEQGLGEEEMARVEEVSLLEEGELDVFIKELRENRLDLSSRMAQLVQKFLDLAGSVRRDSKTFADSRSLVQERTLLSDIEESLGTQPPLVTHPSGGLSYIRTNAYLENHPIYGPQVNHTPIEARVVRPRTAGIQNDKAYFGIGGFVAAYVGNQASFKPAGGSQDPTYALQDIDGGNKVWVKAEHAYMDKDGCVQIQFEKAPSQAVDVKTGNVHPSKLQVAPEDPSNFPRSNAPRGTAENANYGTELPGNARYLTSQRPTIRPFDSAQSASFRSATAGPQSSPKSALDAIIGDVSGR